MNVLVLCREDNLCWENAGYARALRRHGARLMCVEWGTPFNADLRRLIDRCPEKPSLVFRPETDFPLLPWGLTGVDVPTVIFHTDPYAFTHHRVRWSNLFDHVVLLHPGFEDRYRAGGNPKPMTLTHAVDAEIFQGPSAERILEVSSVGRVDGSNYKARREILTELSGSFRMNEWWRRHAYEEMAAVYRATKIVVNVPRDDFPVDVSLRFAEAMAAGALFITCLPSELPSMGFQEGVHFVGFGERRELAGLVRAYLNDEAARRRIAEAGREKVLREHTYGSRVRTLVERLGQHGGRLYAPARQWPEERVRLVYLDFYAASGCLDFANSELRQIAGRSLRRAAAGAYWIARGWARQARNHLRPGVRQSEAPKPRFTSP